MACKEKKFSRGFNDDWEFFYRIKDIFTFYGNDSLSSMKETYNNATVSGRVHTAKEAFCVYDSTGEFVNCDDPDLFFDVLRAKSSFNFHVTDLWCYGLADGTLTIRELIDDFGIPQKHVNSIRSRALSINPNTTSYALV